MNKKRAAVIFAAIVSCYALSATTASYYSARTGGNEVGIAKWDVTLENTSSQLIFNETGTEATKQTIDYEFSLVSRSEVAVDYSVNLEFNTPLPANVSLQVSDGSETQSEQCDGAKKVFTFSGFDCAVGEETKTLTLTVVVDYIKDEKLYEFTTFTDEVKLFVVATQKTSTR